MNGLIASLIFLLEAATTNAAVLNEAGRVCGWWSPELVRQADVTLATNSGLFLLQWMATDGNTWEGVAVVYGGVTNRVAIPKEPGYCRLFWKQ